MLAVAFWVLIELLCLLDEHTLATKRSTITVISVLQRWKPTHLPKVNKSECQDLDLGGLDSEFALNCYAMPL